MCVAWTQRALGAGTTPPCTPSYVWTTTTSSPSSSWFETTTGPCALPMCMRSAPGSTTARSPTGGYDFGNGPALHTAPYYHPVGNPPTQLPPAPQNLVATVLEWENVVPTPPLRPVRTRRATPFPGRHATAPTAVLCLPWYGIGGVPALEPKEVAGGSGVAATADDVELEVEVVDDDAEETEAEVLETAVVDLAALTIQATGALTASEHTEVEHESRAQKRRARRKRARDSARKLRRSLRLQEKEEAGFELPEDKAARVQQAKFDFSSASRRLRNILSRSYLASHDFYPSDDTDSLLDIATACGATEEEAAGIAGGVAAPPAGV